MKVRNLINDKTYEGNLTHDDGDRMSVTTKQKVTFCFQKKDLGVTVQMLDDNPKDQSG